MATTPVQNTSVEQTYETLKQRLAAISDLESIGGLLSWDQQAIMPPRGAEARSHQLATLVKIAHEQFTDDEVGRLLDELQAYEDSLPAESDEASLIRVARRDYDKMKRVPAELAAELVQAETVAFATWVDARKDSDFHRFLPHLERIIELKKKYIACFEPTESPYDVLLDDYEPGMTTAEVKAVFDQLKPALLPLVERIRERVDTVDDSCLHGYFPGDRQRQMLLALLPRFGYDPATMRLDTAPHPFASGIAITDVRLTTRYNEEEFGSAFFGTIHECGHGLYEAGIDPDLARTPIGGAVSLALHESQSRLWENIVGRSRPFWQSTLPLVREYFPDQFANVDVETVYRAANKMQPSLIRVEADEATYALHIIMRFELEQSLMDGSLAAADLPEAWNAKMRDYLGITPPDDAQGVLQDVHWADGLFGYFATYALGSIISVQIWERAKTDMPNIESQFAQGEFLPLREWLRDHLHHYGRKFTARETIELAAGAPLDPDPFIRYITEKVDELYGR
ncbi:MAG TPA: carboxypeptidase M32 [Thermomicrobiales bacterium]|nr:carboxypeptidase M32 [Thermomicrobiales bacterium]